MDRVHFEQAVDLAGLGKFHQEFPEVLVQAAERVETNRRTWAVPAGLTPTIEPAHSFLPLHTPHG
jgi:hypothetical protein